MNSWEDIYPELVNKLRWSISTAFGSPEARYDYSDAQRVATVYAGEIIALLKTVQDVPGLLSSTDAIRKFSAQRDLDRALNSR